MNKQDVYSHVLSFTGSLPVISDHDHHLEDYEFQTPWSLKRIFDNSYISWMNPLTDHDPQSREFFLKGISFSSYFTWLEKGIQAVHGWDNEITSDNWEELSDVICKNHENSRFHLQVIRSLFDKMILDTYWRPGEDNHHPSFFLPSFRIDKFMYGYHKDSKAPDNFYSWKEYDFSGKKLEDYIENMRRTILTAFETGHVKALKCAEAYKRSLNFFPDDYLSAEKIFGTHPSAVNRDEEIVFGNYIFNRCMELAEELELPVQVHTGLGNLSYSQPMKFLPVIEKYPGVNFILFHSGYPWTHQIGGIIHNYSNAIASLTWTPIISTASAINALDDYIDVSPSIHKISWGTDTWTSEEATGALLAWRSVVSRVISDRIVNRDFSINKGERLAEQLMYANNKYIYSI